jgi:hypothetical protein
MLLTVVLHLAPSPKPVTLPDGFYEVLDKGEGTHFPGNDGRTLLLGKNLGKEFGTAAIHSVNNGNTAFGLTLKGAARLWDGPEPLPLALVVDNVCLRLSGNSIPNDDGTRNLWFSISGEEPARKVAKVLKCKVELRSDPGHRLTVKWTPDKETYQVGEPVMLKFEMKNAGKEPVTFRIGGSQRGPRDNQFRFIAQRGYGGGKGVSDIGDPNNFGGKSWTRTLKPGEVYVTKVDLAKWFKFDEPDYYRITGVWSLHLEDPNRDGFDHGLWDDLVCGQCLVRVVKKEKE